MLVFFFVANIHISHCNKVHDNFLFYAFSHKCNLLHVCCTQHIDRDYIQCLLSFLFQNTTHLLKTHPPLPPTRNKLNEMLF